MPGKVKKIIDKIIEKRAGGDPVISDTTKIKLKLKGLDPEKFDKDTEDDPQTIQKAKNIAEDLGVQI